MNKPVRQNSSAIRKKALEHAKKREWDLALKQYIRLAEIEQHNPNVFNELGDLHLKMGNKTAAFESFHAAIDAYTNVSLYNNAVAVCKKIIRLNSTDHNVYGKLARLRNQQGFKKEAATYSMMYLDRVAEDSAINPEDLKGPLAELASEMSHSPEVMERAADYLTKWEFVNEAAMVFEALAEAYTAMGKTSESAAIREKLQTMGIDATAGGNRMDADVNQVQLDPTGGFVPDLEPGTGGSPPPPADGPADGNLDLGTVELGSAEGAAADPSPVATGIDDSPAASPNDPDLVLPRDDPAPAGAGGGANAPSDVSVGDDEVWIPSNEMPDSLDIGGNSGTDGDVVGVTDIVGAFNAEVKANIDSEDYRSHYDLGMAYLEMDLLPEAIREFQFASESDEFRVRSLEMVGVCFIKQNQPKLAIKQLEKGLNLVGEGDREMLGLQYNLGLAFEMTGDVDRAKSCFEEVYVVDVTFREVAEKMKRYST